MYPPLPDGYYNYGNALFPVDSDFCRKTWGAVKSPSPATTTSSATNAVLVLSTWNAHISSGPYANKPMVIGWNGKFIWGNNEMN